MSEKENKNPFRKYGNPDGDFAKLWDKVHSVEIISKQNQTDINWLKKEYAVQIGLSVLTLIGLIITVVYK